jgi:hypothetical protein
MFSQKDLKIITEQENISSYQLVSRTKISEWISQSKPTMILCLFACFDGVQISA